MAERDCRTLRELAADWLSSCGKSDNTVQSYRTALGDVVEHFERESLEPADVRYKHARAWVASLQKRKYNGGTINCYLSAVRTFWVELLNLEIAEQNPFREIKNARYDCPLPEPLAESEMVALIEGEPDLMLRTLWTFFYETGFRCTVTSKLRREQIDFANRSVKVKNKRNREQIQPLRDPMLALLGMLLKAHDSPWVFPGRLYRGTARPIQNSTVRKMLREAAKRIGLERDVRPHQIRHTIATIMYERMGDIRIVQEFLDHTNIGTTQIYTRVSKARLRETINRIHPNEKSE